jgi:hypothetical protein
LHRVLNVAARISAAIASVKVPTTHGSTRDSRVGDRVLAIPNFFEV